MTERLGHGIKTFTGTQLKWIAMILMLIDHTAAVVLASCMASSASPGTAAIVIYYIMRILGRPAFPIFCFLLVEGFHYSHDRRRYLLNLTIFALVSEIPFDLAMEGTILEFGGQNVFFTLSIGLAAIWLIEHFEGKKILQFLSVFVCAVLAELLSTDYASLGVLLIVIFYEFRNQRWKLFAVGTAWLWLGACLNNLINIHIGLYPEEMWGTVLTAVMKNGVLELFGALAFLFISHYNGKRGKSLPKYFFYAFYPGHLLILYGIARLVTGTGM